MATRKKNKTTRKKAARRGAKKQNRARSAGQVVGFTGDGIPLDEADENLRGVIVRKDGRHLDRFLVYLPFEVGQRLRVYAATNREDLSTVVSSAVEAYLEEHNR